jgi:hypothetical protein
MNNGGDALARGQRKAQFPPAKTTQDKWNDAFADFDPEKFKADGEADEAAKRSEERSE